jgi:hypothetical protein
MFRLYCLVIGLAVAVTTLGCGPSVKQEQIEIKVSGANDPLARATTLLERYAGGQPLTSEATSFPAMVEGVRKADPAKADILKAGLDEIQQATPAARPAKAKAVLSKLQAAGK